MLGLYALFLLSIFVLRLYNGPVVCFWHMELSVRFV